MKRMRCENCGKGIADGVSLHRQNEKGVKGIWRCSNCNDKPIDPVVKTILDALSGKEKSDE